MADPKEKNKAPEGEEVLKEGQVVVSQKMLEDIIKENADGRQEKQALLDRLSALETDIKNVRNGVSDETIDEIEDKFKVKKLSLRRFTTDGKIVVEHENVGRAEMPRYAYQERNPNTNEVVDWINIRTQGNTKFVKVRYLDFIQFDSIKEEFDILETLTDVVKSNPDGVVEVIDYAETGKPSASGMMVKALVKTPKFSYRVNIDGVEEIIPANVIG